jgi:two-component system chemotaxis response regulator CheY
MQEIHKTHKNSKLARVLVVDDNDVVRRVLSGIVRQDESLQLVGEATHGEAALQAVRTKAPDLICLDVMMPGIGGLEVLQQLRESSPETKVVIITGYPTLDLVNKARELGATGFIVKPFNAAKVLSVIHVALDTRY